MKSIAIKMVSSLEHRLNSKGHQFAFELFGLDFMLDKKLRPLLI